MGRRKRNRAKFFTFSLLMFIVVFAVAFFGIQYFTKTGIFKVPGVVRYDEDQLLPEQVELIKKIFTEDVELDKDVTITTRNSLEYPELAEGEYIYEITVPVTDFYDTRTDRNEFDEVEVIPISELDFTRKLLSIDGEYYLDTFDKGAYYQIISFDSEKFEEEIKPLVNDTFEKQWPSKDGVLTMAQTGVTALSRGMNKKLSSVGDATYFAEGIKDYLSSFDITHTSNESSFTDFASSENICSDPRFVSTLTAIGLDIVELTGNHNQDCGDEAALSTIDIYNENNIKIVGGGKTANDAAVPLEIDEKGTDITFLAYNLSTGGATYDNTPGANQYYEENAAAEIAAAKQRGNFVIIDIQYYECSAYASEYEDPTCDYANSAAGDQIGFFRHLIDLGADVVVGTSAHQPQTFELYGDGAIYYGLGNLFFDQVWWPGTTRSLVLEHYFYNGKLLQTRITPTVYDNGLQTKLLDKDTAKWFLGRLVSARP
ncbi:CapA family protein [Candidatus Saccharibacteria bacterium]|nr:CapA family protein [Candidatus Saccharibacteria bacterium]